MKDKWKTKWPKKPWLSAGTTSIPSGPIAVIGDAPVLSKLGRNDPCWCGSRKKYKRCHFEMDLEQ